MRDTNPTTTKRPTEVHEVRETIIVPTQASQIHDRMKVLMTPHNVLTA